MWDVWVWSCNTDFCSETVQFTEEQAKEFGTTAGSICAGEIGVFVCHTSWITCAEVLHWVYWNDPAVIAMCDSPVLGHSSWC